MTTVREAITELDHFCCPGCGMPISLDQKYDPSVLDTITIECGQCGSGRAFHDLDTSLPSAIQWRGHEVGIGEEGMPVCAECQQTMDLPPSVASKIPDAYLMLWALGTFEWGSDVAISQFVLEITERFK